MRLIYSLHEYNSENNILSSFCTDDPFVILSSLLIRAIHPFNTIVSLQDSLSETTSVVYRIEKDIMNHPLYLKLKMFTVKRNNENNLVSRCIVDTFASDDNDLILGFNKNNTREFYYMPGYYDAILRLAKRVRKFSKEDIDVAQVLTCYAASNQDHPFWQRNYEWGQRKLKRC